MFPSQCHPYLHMALNWQLLDFLLTNFLFLGAICLWCSATLTSSRSTNTTISTLRAFTKATSRNWLPERAHWRLGKMGKLAWVVRHTLVDFTMCILDFVAHRTVSLLFRACALLKSFIGDQKIVLAEVWEEKFLIQRSIEHVGPNINEILDALVLERCQKSRGEAVWSDNQCRSIPDFPVNKVDKYFNGYALWEAVSFWSV